MPLRKRVRTAQLRSRFENDLGGWETKLSGQLGTVRLGNVISFRVFENRHITTLGRNFSSIMFRKRVLWIENFLSNTVSVSFTKETVKYERRNSEVAMISSFRDIHIFYKLKKIVDHVCSRDFTLMKNHDFSGLAL